MPSFFMKLASIETPPVLAKWAAGRVKTWTSSAEWRRSTSSARASWSAHLGM